jgi:hypothetical protein
LTFEAILIQIMAKSVLRGRPIKRDLNREVQMKTAILGGAALAGALFAGSVASAAAFADYVNVLVPGQTAVTFTAFNDTTSPELFIGITTLPTGFVPGTVILTEPGTGAYSDTLSLLLSSTGGVDVFFFSDPSVAPPGDIGTILATLTETGGVQDVSSYFGGKVLVQVGSDLDVVPEPATWAMTLIGIGMAGGIMRTRRRLAEAVA